ncbi:hypothetical protein H6P81_003940 [Aristolochia fimbriata]|uniref:Uncharacterized protein n=1 Tax=Aristolochia fimbriata TaxID=158543 RepID=A0AAV7FGX7_ARIFI|nr:hypothetical protein H6P81_003940 [Aristolochia fimbriata]
MYHHHSKSSHPSSNINNILKPLINKNESHDHLELLNTTTIALLNNYKDDDHLLQYFYGAPAHSSMGYSTRAPPPMKQCSECSSWNRSADSGTSNEEAMKTNIYTKLPIHEQDHDEAFPRRREEMDLIEMVSNSSSKMIQKVQQVANIIPDVVHG